MPHTFIISDENVNNYGFRVLTDGIDTTQYMKNPVVLYMHERGNVVGKAVKVYKKDGKLLADVEFDMDDEASAAIAGKVERGFLNMTSPWLDSIAMSEETDLIIDGQTGYTVTKSILKEISIVDIGANDEALKLFDQSGNEIKLSQFPKIKNQKSNKMPNLKNIALALGLSSDSEESVILAEVNKLKDEKQNATTKLADVEKDIKLKQKAEAVELVDKGVKLGLIPEALKEGQIKLFDGDFNGSKSALTTAIAAVEKKEDPKEDEMPEGVKLFLNKVGKGDGKEKPTALKLSDFSDKELTALQKNKPEEFQKLVDNYEGKSF